MCNRPVCVDTKHIMIWSVHLLPLIKCGLGSRLINHTLYFSVFILLNMRFPSFWNTSHMIILPARNVPYIRPVSFILLQTGIEANPFLCYWTYIHFQFFILLNTSHVPESFWSGLHFCSIVPLRLCKLIPEMNLRTYLWLIHIAPVLLVETNIWKTYI